MLLDECVDRRLAPDIQGHDVKTVPEAGWAAFKNGELLAQAGRDFEAFVTIDRNRGGYHAHPNVRALHPPIDAVLLKGLAERNVGDLAHRWRSYASMRWSNLDCSTHEAAIADIRSVVPQGAPLWTIEQFWQGYQ